MKKIDILFLLCLLPLLGFAQEIHLGSINPEFIKYLNDSNNIGRVQTKDGYGLGGIPTPNKPSFRGFNGVSQLKSTSAIAKYDLRTAGLGGTSLLTSVKNQKKCGACWTFATMATIESRWKVLGIGDVDLSENNLKECNDFNYSACSGGNIEIAIAYLSRFQGPYYETDDLYSDVEQNSCVSGHDVAGYVTDARLLPNDASIIKQSIIDYGALYTTMRWEDSSYTSATNTYYYNGSGTENHGVTIVGWDDSKITAGGKGAWIIKNSWGSNWGEEGYFYISYNDSKINSKVGFFPLRSDFDADSKLYYYDKLGCISSFGYDSDDYALVKYVASGNETLTKVGIWVNGANTSISIDVYDNFNGTVLTGLLSKIAPQTCILPGYYTFNLTTVVNLFSGNDFYIRVRYNCPEESSVIPIESESNGYASPFIENGVCWISDDNTQWEPIGSSTAYPYDLCIKAFTKNGSSAVVDVEENNERIKVYPNPVENNLTIECAGNKVDIGFEILNSNGFSVYKGELTEKAIVNTANFASGVYIIKLDSGKTFEFKKVIKIL